MDKRREIARDAIVAYIEAAAYEQLESLLTDIKTTMKLTAPDQSTLNDNSNTDDNDLKTIIKQMSKPIYYDPRSYGKDAEFAVYATMGGSKVIINITRFFYHDRQIITIGRSLDEDRSYWYYINNAAHFQINYSPEPQSLRHLVQTIYPIRYITADEIAKAIDYELTPIPDSIDKPTSNDNTSNDDNDSEETDSKVDESHRYDKEYYHEIYHNPHTYPFSTVFGVFHLKHDNKYIILDITTASDSTYPGMFTLHDDTVFYIIGHDLTASRHPWGCSIDGKFEIVSIHPCSVSDKIPIQPLWTMTATEIVNLFEKK